MRALDVIVLPALALCAVACEPEVGGICDPDPDEVSRAVTQVAQTNNIVQDVQLDYCSQGFCMSTDGSRPYCTKVCQTDVQCAEAGAGFVCAETVIFGPLACSDWEDPLQEQPAKAGTSSLSPCAGSSDCPVEGESCFLKGELQGKCGFAGRDCLNGQDGGQSLNPIKYCAARSPEVIAERDLAHGRKPSNK